MTRPSYIVKVRLRGEDGRWGRWKGRRYRYDQPEAERAAAEERATKRVDKDDRPLAAEVSIWFKGKRIDYRTGDRQRGIQAFHGSGLWEDKGDTNARRYACAVCGEIVAEFERGEPGVQALGDASKGKAAVLAHVRARHPDALRSAS